MFTFKGITATSKGIKVTDVRRDILPPISLDIEQNLGTGSIIQHRRYESRKIEIDYVIPPQVNLQTKVRELAEWLQSTRLEAIIFDDETDKKYMAILDGETSFEQTIKLGQGTLVFFCPSPYAVAVTPTVLTLTSGNSLDYASEAEIFPQLYFKVATATSSYTIEKYSKPDVYIADFNGSLTGDVVTNPHIYKYRYGASPIPVASGFTSESTQSHYTAIYSDNNSNSVLTTTTNGAIATGLFQFNIVEFYEREIGIIPALTLADKITWLGENIATLICNWSGKATGPAGSTTANFAQFHMTNGTWDAPSTRTGATEGTLTCTSNAASLRIDANGYINYIIYGVASDGVTASVVETDYVYLEVWPKKDYKFVKINASLAVGNTVEIDCENGTVAVNGTDQMAAISLDSEFFSLYGQNNFIVFPTSLNTGKARYYRKYL